MIYGNHDIIKKRTSFAEEKCAFFYCTSRECVLPLFPGITFYQGIILEHSGSGKRFYLTHGYQASLLNSTLWPIARLLVRYVWKPLEQIGILDPTSAAKNYTEKLCIERRLETWAKEHDVTLITGHTHRPRIVQEEPYYMNAGSCVHPHAITCIEIENDTVTLAKWQMNARADGSIFVEHVVGL